MGYLLNTLYCALLAVFLSCCTPHAAAEAVVNIQFVKDAASGQEVIQAKSVFKRHGHSLQKVLNAIGEYAGLHPWITSAALISENASQTDDFLIEFRFPWPVGYRWSHIRVQQDGGRGISWQQIKGDLQANEGWLRFTAHHDQGMTVEYGATIDLGLPDIVLRSFKKKFVAEFINAAYVQAAYEELSELALATPGSYTDK